MTGDEEKEGVPAVAKEEVDGEAEGGELHNEVFSSYKCTSLDFGKEHPGLIVVWK